MKPVIIIAIAFVLLIPTTAFGAVDGYFEETYPKAFTHPPTVCLIQPNDPKITEQKWNNWYVDMKPAIDTWRSTLQSSGSGNWEITTVNVPIEKLELLNYSKCDVQVNFIERPYESYSNYFGRAHIGAGLIEMVYLDSYVCGNQYHSELDLTVATFCPTNNTIRSKQMANTLQHEFGHIVGLGHYRGYDRSTTQEWYDGEKNAPSIMAWIEPNEEMRQISQIDVSKVREVYGSQGFGKQIDSSTPLFNEPYIPEPVIPVAGVINLHITGNSVQKMITGYIPDTLYKRGSYLEIEIQKPNGFTESEITTVSKNLHSFKHNLIFNQSYQEGRYIISLKFDGTVFEKIPINLSKSSVSSSYASNSISGKYLENIIIKENSNKYTVTSQFSSSYSSNQIRIIAENECPFKKQVFQQDFRFDTGKPISFSFSQSSIGKPSVCAIHFTVTNFEGHVLDSIKAEYSPQTKQSVTFPSETTAFVNEKDDNSIFTNEQKQKMKQQNEAGLLQQEAYFELQDFKNDVQVSKNSLEQISANSPEQQKTLDKAWKLMKSTQIILKNMAERFQKGDGEISEEKYDSVDYLFDIRKHESRSIGENLVEISQLIEEFKSQSSEKSKPQTCFLMWCW